MSLGLFTLIGLAIALAIVGGGYAARLLTHAAALHREVDGGASRERRTAGEGDAPSR